MITMYKGKAYAVSTIVGAYGIRKVVVIGNEMNGEYCTAAKTVSGKGSRKHTSLMVAVAELFLDIEAAHEEAIAMNEQYDAQKAEIQRIEFHVSIDADLVKVCSMRMFLFQRSQRQNAYTLISYDKYVNPLFDLLDEIASDLAGYRVYASEHNWIVESAAYKEADTRYEAALEAEFAAQRQANADAAAPIEAEVSPYEILLNLMGEDAFCKAILKPEAYAAYQERKAAKEEEEAILIEMNEHHHGYTHHEGEIVGETFDDLWPARETGYEREQHVNLCHTYGFIPKW